MKKILEITKNFRHYFWIGIIIILISIILDVSYQEKNIYLKVTILFLQTIGVSMFVASIFSFVIDTISFQNKLEKLVEQIVLKRDFLVELPIEKKKEAIEYLIKPTAKEIEKYSNINNFYTNFIEEIINVSNENVRSNYTINAKIKYEHESKLVYSEFEASYRLYPSNNGYTDIIVGFLKGDTNSYVDIYINLPDGNRKKFEFSELEFEENDTSKKTKIEINDLCKEHHHVDVELRGKEYGNNHWINYFFKAEQATDGFKISISCFNELTIKNCLIFDVGHNYHIDISDDETEFNINCNQWIEKGAGISLIISREEKA